jgi:hypothetical protein
VRFHIAGPHPGHSETKAETEQGLNLSPRADVNNPRKLPLVSLLPVLLYLLACLAETSAILRVNDGRFVYTLDDAYVHLAMAENIARGHYGINLEEASAPSSSVLWPFLLAPFSRWDIGEYVPLAVNLLASAATLVLIGQIVSFSFRDLPEHGKSATIVLSVIAIGLATNIVGLSFTGMEHPLQVLLAVALVWGLILEKTDNTVPRWLVPVIVLGPLIRFENLALSVPAAILLVASRHGRAAIFSTLGLLLGLGGFALFLHRLGLGWLPTSVLLKVPILSDYTGQFALGEGLLAKLFSAPSILLSLGILFLLVFAVSAPQDPARLLALWACLGGLAHLLAGRFGWFARYEIYVWSAILLTVMYVYRERLVAFISGRSPIFPLTLGAFALLTLGQNYLIPSIQTPIGSNNIYEQHYQMHRFATEFVRGPVAVNDIGFVSYRNDNYVLDLYGLSSGEALRLRRSATSVEWMDALAKEHHVQAAMLYELWFPKVPRTWIPLARMYLGKANLTPASDVVTIYALDPAAADRIRPQLRLFSRTLPAEVAVDLLQE